MTEKETIEIGALDENKLIQENPNFTVAQVIAATLFRLKGIVINPDSINHRTVKVEASSGIVESIRSSLRGLGFMEIQEDMAA